MTPSFGFNFQPDFSSDRFGYYQRLEDSLGVLQEYDYYSGSLFGSTSSGGRQALRIGFTNLYQMKIGEGDKVKKFDLFTWNISTSYNWKAKQYKLSDISSSFRVPLRNISIDMRAIHSLYQVDDVGRNNKRLNQIHLY